MNYSSDVAAFTSLVEKILVEKLPVDFCEKHPMVVIGGLLFLCTLPQIGQGVKYITDKYTSFCYFKVAAENGLLSAPSIEAPKTLVLDEPVAV